MRRVEVYQLRPFSLPLFTQVRGINVLGIAIGLIAQAWLEEKANREEHGLPGPFPVVVVEEEGEDGEPRYRLEGRWNE
jgi:hypothetical protein